MTRTATFHDLENKSVFITGGGSGIGAALTDGFMAQGAQLAFVQRPDATEFCDEMEARHGTRPLFRRGDITDTAALQSCIVSAGAAHGSVIAPINNAANDKRHDALEADFWDWSQAINLNAYFFTCRAAIPMMRAAGGGAIANFTSISYMMGNAGYVSYSTANSGINGMTGALARESGPDHIRVNALAPGWVLTEKQMGQWAAPEALTAHLERQCLKDHLAPQDIVDATLFLASGTSRMMTEQAMMIDGGVVGTG